MLLALLLQISVQIGPPPRRNQGTVVRDSSADSASRNAARRLPVTPALLASAFKDATARELFDRAQRARITQDSAIHSYDAKAVQRLSVGMGIGKLGRDRLLYRQESAARVQWQEGVGVWIDLTGARVAIPMVTPKEEDDALKDDLTDTDMSPIPYFPGYESLWIGGTTATTDVNDRNIVNPLARGAEAYYTYEAGDSVSWKLPDGAVVQIRELKVRPRSTKWNLAVGSLWCDTKSGQLVRAAYRLAVPMDMWTVIADDSKDRGGDDVPALVTGFVSPLEAQITAIAVEYTLVDEHIWLPRTRSMEGTGQALFMHVPLEIETSFTYTSVNRTTNLPRIPVDTITRRPLPFPPQPRGLDTAGRRKWRDSINATRGAAQRASTDSVHKGLKPPPPGERGACVPDPAGGPCTWRTSRQLQCDTGSTFTSARYRYDVRLPVGLKVLCDIEALKHSPDLPPSIYSPGEEVFGTAGRDALIASALNFAAQAPFQVGNLFKPRVQWGLSMTRYNRVEGLSTGVLLEDQLGAGYVATAVGRLGVADLEPNVELSLARTNLSKTIRVTGYNRLVSAGDWGNPLSFSASMSAFLFGRDEGFYYRATGGDVQWTSERGARLEWRAFGEEQRTAEQNTTYSWGPSFHPNIVAARGLSTGAAVRYLNTHGMSANGLRVFTDVRLEAATGDSTYGRGAADVTVSHGLGDRFATALTVAGGSSVGQLPNQRRWYLGGSQTIRGQQPDTAQNGNAFWMGRLELAQNHTGYRTSLFGDLGWAGDRTKVLDIVRPMSGVGLGWSMFDALLRFDIARGIYPRKQWRLDMYLEARF